MNNRVRADVMNNEMVGSRVSDGLIEEQHTKVHYRGFTEGYVLTMQMRRKQSHIYTDTDNLANRKS